MRTAVGRPGGYRYEMTNHVVTHETDVPAQRWADPVKGELEFRTLVEGGGESDFTGGVAVVPPGGWLGRHRHEPAEIYFVVAGNGVLTLDDEDHALRPGCSVFVPSLVEHGVRNAGDVPLQVFYVLAAGSMDEVDYDFSQS
jgi:oxalate decarboxylase/phosphoglucose isomerase-like protein (cupin superfamily)